MTHAAPEVAFHVFMWSYLFIAFFLLLNIFLAILVDAYAAVKGETAVSKGILEDLLDVAWNGARQLVSSEAFVSDRVLEETLLEEQAIIDTKESQRHLVESKYSKSKSVLLSSGVQVDPYDMAQFAQRALEKVKMNRKNDRSNLVEEVAGKEEVGPEGGELVIRVEEQDADRELSPTAVFAAFDLIQRYGVDPSAMVDTRVEELLQLHTLEGIRRQISLQMGQMKLVKMQQRLLQHLDNMAADQGKAPISVEEEFEDVEASERQKQGETLSVRLIEARELPRMDLLSGCDAYCILFLNACEGQSMFTSSTIPKSLHPVWEEKFDWKLTPASSTLYLTVWDEDKLVVVQTEMMMMMMMMMMKAVVVALVVMVIRITIWLTLLVLQVSKDDFIGMIQVDIAEMAVGEEKELTLPVINQDMMSKVRNSVVKLQLQKTSSSAPSTSSSEERRPCNDATFGDIRDVSSLNANITYNQEARNQQLWESTPGAAARRVEEEQEIFGLGFIKSLFPNAP
eukprot:766112-Hanusia_phi.AAC.3